MKLYIVRLLVSIDQFINVLLYPALNLLLGIGSAAFGHPDETITSVLGKNVRSGHCKGCKFICRYLLRPFGKNHCDKVEEDHSAGIIK